MRTHGPARHWKGFLRLSLVTCPVALYPATSESEKISFNQLNRQTGHRIKYLKVDADTAHEVANEDIVKGYQLEKDRFIEVTKEELEELALESTRTIEIDEFVDKADIDPRYLIRPYYLRPDGKVGHDAFAVIQKTFLHRGISTRSFKRQFTLADHVEVKGARFEKGPLVIELQREIPEAMKPRHIPIGSNVTQIEAKAA